MTIATGADLKRARNTLGLSCDALGERLRLSPEKGRQAVREMESGRRPITGPVAVAVELMLRVREIELALERRDPMPF